jgi:effector-binding domain-containing protein
MISSVSPIEVSFVTVPPRATAVVAEVTSWERFPALWRALLDEVYGFVRGREDLATDAGAGGERWQNVMLYKDDTPEVEVGVLVARPFPAQGRVIASELPGGEVATAVHHGDYARLGATHDAVRAFAAAHERELAGPRWEIYGHWREDPSELETEVFWLLR